MRVRTPDATRLVELLRADGVTITSAEPSLLEVNGLTAPQIGELAARSGVVLHELTPAVGSLEDAYLSLTQDVVEYHAGGTAPGTSATPLSPPQTQSHTEDVR